MGQNEWSGTIFDIKKGAKQSRGLQDTKTTIWLEVGGDPHFVGPEADHIWRPSVRERIKI